jgi:hypothetical protein
MPYGTPLLPGSSSTVNLTGSWRHCAAVPGISGRHRNLP